MQNVNFPYNLSLASTSKFRKQLLSTLNLPGGFDVFSPNIDESPTPQELANPQQLALRLAVEKARAFLHSEQFLQNQQNQDSKFLVIGSDQVAFVSNKSNSKIYGKPGSIENAKQQLAELSGKEITFFTALSLFDSHENSTRIVAEPTYVKFRNLSETQIDNYLRLEPDAIFCAGAAKSEGLGITLLNYIRGDDPNALIGLPLIALCDLFADKGIVLP